MEPRHKGLGRERLIAMDRDAIDRLMHLAAPHERIRLSVLYNASVQTLKAYQSDPTAPRLKDWRAADAALAEAVSSLEHNSAPSSPERLARAIDVHRHLRAAGWRCSQSSVYAHIQRGLLGEHRDGGYEVAAVEKYAAANLKRIGGAPANAEPGRIIDLTREVQEAELQKKRAQALHWETRALVERDLYIEKADFNAELAARATLFRSDLENLANSRAGDMIALVAGDHTRTADLIEWLQSEFASMLARYAAPNEWPRRTRVDFGADEDAEEATA